ncbi:MAG: hypothetical protein V3V98_07085 [Thermoplasmata archaeon]
MKILDEKLTILFLVVLALFALSAISLIYGLVQALGSRYHESTFLIGVGFIVLAFAVFTYRAHQYPDEKPQATEEE